MIRVLPRQPNPTRMERNFNEKPWLLPIRTMAPSQQHGQTTSVPPSNPRPHQTSNEKGFTFWGTPQEPWIALTAVYLAVLFVCFSFILLD